MQFYRVPLFIICALVLQLFLTSCGEKLDGKSIDELLGRAYSLSSEGNWSSALKYAQAAAERAPENADAQVMLALVYENTEKPQLALQYARAAVKSDPKSFLAQYTLGRLYAKSPGKVQDSIEPLKRALKIKPDDVNTITLLAEASQTLGLLDTIHYFKRLSTCKRYEKSPAPWNQMGIIYALQNDLRNAARCFVTAYNRDPKNHTIVLNFAIFLDQYINNQQRALSYYKEFLRLVDGNSAYAETSRKVRERITQINGK